MGNAVALPARARTARIDQWRLVNLGGRLQRLEGVVSGHYDEHVIDGVRYVTSAIVRLDEAAGIAVTRNTTYTLGRKAA